MINLITAWIQILNETLTSWLFLLFKVSILVQVLSIVTIMLSIMGLALGMLGPETKTYQIRRHADVPPNVDEQDELFNVVGDTYSLNRLVFNALLSMDNIFWIEKNPSRTRTKFQKRQRKRQNSLTKETYTIQASKIKENLQHNSELFMNIVETERTRNQRNSLEEYHTHKIQKSFQHFAALFTDLMSDIKGREFQQEERVIQGGVSLDHLNVIEEKAESEEVLSEDNNQNHLNLNNENAQIHKDHYSKNALKEKPWGIKERTPDEQRGCFHWYKKKN